MNERARTGIVRSLMILFWVVAICTFIFMPLVTRLFYQQKSINLFIWPMILDANILTTFEKETGIKVYVNYYESNEELYSKLQATGGQGYDLIVPTDYMVEILSKNNLLKKLDTSKLEFISEIKPHLLHHYFDPGNSYSIPYYVTVFGLGINKDFFGGAVPTPSWSLVFDKNKTPGSLCMTDGTREAIMLAGYYLYGSIDKINTPERLCGIKQLLQEQKTWVYIYSSFRVEELLASKSCPLAVGTSTDVWKVQREYPSIEFVIPQEGTFATIDSLVIPQATDKDAMVYQLINFLYRHDVVRHNSRKYGYCPPLTTVATEDQAVFCPTAEQFQHYHFFKNVLTRAQMQNVWIAVKGN